MQERFSTILLWAMFILIVLSITATYYKTVVLRDFEVIDDLDEVEELDNFEM